MLTHLGGRFALHKTIYKPGGKTVTATDPVVNLKVLPQYCIVKLATGVNNGAPVVHGGRFGVTKRRSDHFEIRIVLDHLRNHLPEIRRVELRIALIETFNLIP